MNSLICFAHEFVNSEDFVTWLFKVALNYDNAAVVQCNISSDRPMLSIYVHLEKQHSAEEKHLAFNIEKKMEKSANAFVEA